MEATPYASTLIVFMGNVAILAGTPLAVATVIGLIVAFFQAITQLQDQSLAQTVKIVAIALTLFFFGAALATPLITSSAAVFEGFPDMVR
jgi:type III secretory pathway component EscS